MFCTIEWLEWEKKIKRIFYDMKNFIKFYFMKNCIKSGNLLKFSHINLHIVIYMSYQVVTSIPGQFLILRINVSTTAIYHSTSQSNKKQNHFCFPVKALQIFQYTKEPMSSASQAKQHYSSSNQRMSTFCLKGSVYIKVKRTQDFLVRNLGSCPTSFLHLQSKKNKELC